MIPENGELPDLQVLDAADAWSVQHDLLDLTLRGRLDPLIAKHASEIVDRMSATFRIVADNARLGALSPETFSPDLLDKLDGKGIVAFVGNSKQAARDRERYQELFEARMKRMRGDRGGIVEAVPMDRVEGTSVSCQGADADMFDLLDQDVATSLAREDQLVEMLLTPGDLRSFGVKARAAGFDTAGVAELAEGGFADRFRLEVLVRFVLPRLPSIVQDLVTRADAGDLSAVRVLADFLRGSGIGTAALRKAVEDVNRVDEVMKDLRSKGDRDDHEGHGKREDA